MSPPFPTDPAVLPPTVKGPPPPPTLAQAAVQAPAAPVPAPAWTPGALVAALVAGTAGRRVRGSLAARRGAPALDATAAVRLAKVEARAASQQATLAEVAERATRTASRVRSMRRDVLASAGRAEEQAAAFAEMAAALASQGEATREGLEGLQEAAEALQEVLAKQVGVSGDLVRRQRALEESVAALRGRAGGGGAPPAGGGGSRAPAPRPPASDPWAPAARPGGDPGSPRAGPPAPGPRAGQPLPPAPAAVYGEGLSGADLDEHPRLNSASSFDAWLAGRGKAGRGAGATEGGEREARVTVRRGRPDGPPGDDRVEVIGALSQEALDSMDGDGSVTYNFV